jgi:Mlc titration factor MtfA (ptsG expression regulator)
MGIIFSVVVLLILTIAAQRILRVKRRQCLRSRPFPENWRQLLEDNIPLYRMLPQDLKNQLHGLINLFIDEKTFIGCRDQQITDQVKITIAAQACMLLLNRPTKLYPRLSTIYVYPQTYVVDVKHHDDGLIVEDKDVRLGESWHNGPVVLAWDSVTHAARSVQHGQNVVLHEFAHQLDQEDGVINGTPLLDSPSTYQIWAAVLGAEYEKLCDTIHAHHQSILDPYGATDPAEFFAVATEAFFEKPHQLLKHSPRLYEEFKNYFKLDPAQWSVNKK